MNNMFTDADYDKYESKMKRDGLKMLKINSMQNEKEYSDLSARESEEVLDLVGQNVKNFNLRKTEPATKVKQDFNTPTKIDFEKMTPAERRRLNFKKAGTAAYQPHFMRNIKKDKLN